MRKILWLIMLVPIALVGAWFAWAEVLDRGFSAWLDQRRGEGWVAEARVIETTGFPVRFRTRAVGLDLADPETGLSLVMPGLTLESESFSPNDIAATFPENFVVATPIEQIEVTASRFEASLAVDPGPALGLRRADLLLEDIKLDSSLRWTSSLASATLRAERAVDDELVQSVTFTAADFVPSAPLRRTLDPAGVFPETIEQLAVDAVIGFDTAWDRRAIEVSRPQIRTLDLTALDAVWGDARLEAAGALTVDEEGVPDGTITVRATNWREIFAVLRNARLVPDGFAPAIESVLESLAGLSGRPETLDAPLRFSNGLISFGPIPLGPAPRIVIR
ncbi:MAG: DUF2125 domain-containing protein [Pseudomonadota bacterium]